MRSTDKLQYACTKMAQKGKSEKSASGLGLYIVLTSLALVTTVSIFYGGYYLFPCLPVPASDDFSSKLVYTFRCAFAPLLVLMTAILMVGNKRRTSGAYPLTGKEHLLQLEKNFLANTLEQFVVFLVSTLVLITYLQGEEMRLVPLSAIAFFVGRVLFRVGYGIAYYYRGWGMSINFISQGFIIGLTGYLMFTRGFMFGIAAAVGSPHPPTAAHAEL